jgi:glycosyltransferase involved in cell wall biosynthesis
MKVLMVNKFNYLRGGADKYFLDLSHLLQINGVEVAHFCMHHPQNMPDKHNQYFVSYLNFNKFSWRSALKYFSRMFYSFEAKEKFERLVIDFAPDVIHLHNIYHQLSPSILSVAKKYHIPVVMHLHDYKLVCPNYKMFHHGKICESCSGGKYWRCITHRCFQNSLFKSILVAMEMWLHHKVLKIYEKNVACYIAPSDFMRNKMIANGVLADKLQTIHHFLDTNDLQPQYDVGNYFLYVGRLSEEKGIEQLLQATQMVRGARLKIVGAGSMSNFVKKEIARLQINDRVEIIGPKYHEELQHIVRDSLAVVVPSIWYEVFGLVALEASALGKAVLAADIGGLPEVVQDKVSGLLFNPFLASDLAAKMQWASTHQIELSAMGRSGRSLVEQNFTPQEHFSKIMGVYKEVMGK